jgi:hypothetical protein
MTVCYNVTGIERRALASTISEILDQPMNYQGTPRFLYEVGGHTIDTEGTLAFAIDTGDEARAILIAALEERGYEVTGGEETSFPSDAAIVAPLPSDSDNSHDRLTLDMPLDGFTDKAIENLKNLVTSKNRVIKKALGTNSLIIDITDEKLSFPWFTLTGAEGEMDAYLRFVTALCMMAKKQKRVTARDRGEVINEKFTMRVFLIRLGFVGSELRTARKILLRNLTGNSAWKYGTPTRQNEEAVPDGK